MEADGSEVYARFSSVVHVVFLSTTLVAQSVLLFFGIFCSPRQLGGLRFLLITTSCLQITVTVILFYVQPRILAGTGINVPVYSYGQCRKVDSFICFDLYMLWQTLSLGVAISLTYTLYFKYRKLDSNVPFAGFRLAFSLLLAYMPFYVSIVCGVIITTRKTQPGVGQTTGNASSEYKEIGRMTLGEIPNRINFAALAFGIYVVPLFAFWFRWKSLKTMNEKMVDASPILKYHTKAVMKGLTIQVLSHFLFYIPMFSVYTYCVLTNTQIYFQQFFLTMFPNLTAILDPLVNLYYVVPYRNQILRLFGRKFQVVPIGVSSNQGIFRTVAEWMRQ